MESALLAQTAVISAQEEEPENAWTLLLLLLVVSKIELNVKRLLCVKSEDLDTPSHQVELARRTAQPDSMLWT